MSDSNGLGGYFNASGHNTVLAWLFVAVLGGSVVGGVAASRPEPVLFGVAAVVVVTAPAIRFRDPAAVPPWYFVGLICLPVSWEVFSPVPLATATVPSLAVATLGLLITVELDRFTSLRLVPWFAVVFTVLLTLAMSGLLNVLRWSSDVLFGTTHLLDGRSQDAINAAVMIEFGYATVAGVLAGVIFYAHFRRAAGAVDDPVTPPSDDAIERGRDDVMAAEEAADHATAEEVTIDGATTDGVTGDGTSDHDIGRVVLSERLGVSVGRQRQAVRSMQVVLVGVFVYGVWSRQIAVMMNAALTLAITFIPAVLERDYEVTIEPGLVLWVTAAVFFHALGSAGLYDAISTWDHLTHTLSATVVAAAGYATLRAIHLHSAAIHLPRWATFSFLLVFMLAMSVIWEVLEFVVDQGALRLGTEPILAQHGIDDTIMDMLFNLLGSVLFAAWGTVYLTEVSESLATALEKRLDTVDETGR